MPEFKQNVREDEVEHCSKTRGLRLGLRLLKVFLFNQGAAQVGLGF